MNFEGKTVVGYGVGFYYEAVKEKAREIMRIDYLCDAKWDDSDIKEYDGIPVLKRKDLDAIENKVLVIFSCNEPIKQLLAKEFGEKGYEYHFAMTVLGARALSGAEVKAEGREGVLKIGSNTIYYDESLPDNVWFNLIGFNARVKIGKNLIIDSLTITVGSNCECTIGNDVRIVITNIDVSGAKLEIGDDCLFSYNTEIRTHDSHVIFDKKTKKRINYPKDVIVGSQVWLAAGAKLLPGAQIGAGSIVGANAVTSSKFGDHVVIAGNPAKVMREDVIWSKDNTAFSDYESFEDCIERSAEKYL